jgi:hypothetical protein
MSRQRPRATRRPGEESATPAIIATLRQTRPLFAFLAALLLTACAQSQIRPHPSEQTVADFVFRHTGLRPTDVQCPSGVPAKAGSTFDCHFTGPDGRYTAHVRITSVDGQRASDYIITRRID